MVILSLLKSHWISLLPNLDEVLHALQVLLIASASKSSTVSINITAMNTWILSYVSIEVCCAIFLEALASHFFVSFIMVITQSILIIIPILSREVF